ncbi:hypothetical protein ACQKEF_22290 [Pseudomonas oryzihabitans]|uniref:hypothetical protein n=1 Tax=Pseudomonas TaxID=286 RepID=UPI00226A114A|nr:hypothetical protein [Pseudomonas sp. GM_Psu_2]
MFIKKQKMDSQKSSLRLFGRFLMKFKALLPVVFIAASPSAHAVQLSTFFNNMTSELSAGMKFGLLLASAAGILIGVFSLVSFMIAKKNQEPAKWQMWGMVIGGVILIAPLIMLAVAGSISGGAGGAAQTFNDLGISQ